MSREHAAWQGISGSVCSEKAVAEFTPSALTFLCPVLIASARSRVLALVARFAICWRASCRVHPKRRVALRDAPEPGTGIAATRQPLTARRLDDRSPATSL